MNANESFSFYSAYGLNIKSALNFPELTVQNGNSINQAEYDIFIRFGKVAETSTRVNLQSRYFNATRGGVLFFIPSVGSFLIKSCREITIDPVPGVDEVFLRLATLGPALSILLHQRGLLVFHASAVAFAGRAVAFLAHKGQGKSTMATAFYFQGHNLLADDIMAVEADRNCLMVKPAFPQTKLWPEALEALGEQAHSLPTIHPDSEKRTRAISHGFAEGPHPLRCVFLLSVGEEIEILPLKPQDALINVLPHWYAAQFDGELLEILGRKNHFRQCLRLVQHVPVYILKRPPSLARLPEVTQHVEEFLITKFPKIET